MAKPVDTLSPQHFPNPQLGQLKKENVSKLLLTVLTVIVKHIEHEELLVNLYDKNNLNDVYLRRQN